MTARHLLKDRPPLKKEAVPQMCRRYQPLEKKKKKTPLLTWRPPYLFRIVCKRCQLQRGMERVVQMNAISRKKNGKGKKKKKTTAEAKQASLKFND